MPALAASESSCSTTHEHAAPRALAACMRSDRGRGGCPPSWACPGPCFSLAAAAKNASRIALTACASSRALLACHTSEPARREEGYPKASRSIPAGDMHAFMTCLTLLQLGRDLIVSARLRSLSRLLLGWTCPVRAETAGNTCWLSADVPARPRRSTLPPESALQVFSSLLRCTAPTGRCCQASDESLLRLAPIVPPVVCTVRACSAPVCTIGPTEIFCWDPPSNDGGWPRVDATRMVSEAGQFDMAELAVSKPGPVLAEAATEVAPNPNYGVV